MRCGALRGTGNRAWFHLAIAVGSVGGACSAPSPTRPNVLLVVMDAVRADHLSAYGYHERTSPNLEALARDGVLYEQAITASSWTLPSHATLFTGLHPRDHRTTAESWTLRPELTTLAEELAAAGYETAGFSNNPWLSEGTGLQQGFSSFVDVWRRTAPRAEADDGAAETNRRIRAWLDGRDAGVPFFLFVNYIEPHFPYEPPVEYQAALVPQSADPRLVAELRSWRPPRELGYILGLPGMEVTPEQFELLRALYDAEIAYLDSRLGELTDELSRRALLDETLVVITSDHGEHLGDHALMDHKLSLYEALIRVPLVVRYPPAVPAGVRIRGQVQANDVYGGVLALCGIERSLRPGAFPLPFSEEDVSRRFSVAELARPAELMKLVADRFPEARRARWDRSLLAVRGDRYKLIAASDGTVELFDIVMDPGETVNIAAERGDILADLEERRLSFEAGGPGGVHAPDP